MEREFEFTEHDFREIRRLLRKSAGIAIAKTQPDLVYTRLRERLDRRGLRSFSEYIDFLRRTPEESEPFVNSLTTNHTAFFREQEHFEALRRFMASRPRRPLRIWSAACSTGEEPYSIAMTVHEATFGNMEGVSILASDIDTDVLATAKRALYPEAALTGVSEERAARYFVADPKSGQRRILPELRRRVTFARLNLLEPDWNVPAQFDVIFCRNVLFYFKRETQLAILERLRERLHPEGLLFTGYAEILHYARTLFAPVGHAVHQPAKRLSSRAA